MNIVYYTLLFLFNLCCVGSIYAAPPMLGGNVVDTINQDLIATESNPEVEDIDKARDEMQDLKAEVEKLRLELEKKEELVKETIDNKNKQVLAQKEADLIYLLTQPPFNAIYVDNKIGSYKTAYQKILNKEYVDIDLDLNQYINDANNNALEIVSKDYLTSYDNNDMNEPSGILSTSQDIKNDDILPPVIDTINKSPREKVLDSKSKPPLKTNNKASITNKEAIINDVAKAYYLIGEVQLVNAQFKESLINLTNAYKISKNVEIQIHSLFDIAFIFQYQKKSKELCYTLLRISQTLDVYSNSEVALDPRYQEKLQTYFNENNCQ